MKQKITLLLPSAFEWTVCFLLAAAFCFVGNMHQILSFYSIGTTTQIIGHSIGTVVSTALNRINTFQATPTVVTFIFWAIVGLMALSILHVVGTAIGDIMEQRNLATDKYVHPANFNRRAFWKQFFIDLCLSFVAFTTTVGLFAFFFIWLAPVGITYTRLFLLVPSLFNALFALAGVVIVTIGIVLLSFGIRLVRWRLYVFNRG